MRRTNSWFRLWWDMGSLGVESSAVIALRLAKISTGGPAADRESTLMVDEKVAAASDLYFKAMTGALGFAGPTVLAKTLTHYRRKVRANRRRLSK